MIHTSEEKGIREAIRLLESIIEKCNGSNMKVMKDTILTCEKSIELFKKDLLKYETHLPL